MPVKSYFNFDLLLNEAGDSYEARVVDSPAGQAVHRFSLPFSALELEVFILKIGQNRGGVRSLHLEGVDVHSVKKLGSALYDCLFSGDVEERFRTSLAIAERAGMGLRIRLRLSGAPSLINIPWELLFDAANNDYIGLSVNTPVIRKLDLAQQPSIRQAVGVLRVLVMISSPTGYYPLDVKREWERINTATQGLQSDGKLMLEQVEPSLAALQRALRRGEYHVFHYIGHGGFDSQNNDGLLVLEDKDKKGHLVSGQYLGALLHDETTLQLVLLNSCSGGRTSATDPFAGVGQSLLQKSIPAVIAMQFEITDDAAITFSHEFYAALADGYPIDAAVAEARKMIYAEDNQLEWATPVLYTSIDGGGLLREPTPEELLYIEKQQRQREEIKRQVGLQPQAEERKPQEELMHQTESHSVGLPLPTIKTISEPLLVAPQVFAWKTIAIIGVMLMLGIGGFVWKRYFDVQPIESEMVSIPAGTFTMGCVKGRDDANNDCENDEKPAHKVTLSAFQIGKYEVTFDEWDACEKAKACPHAEDQGWGRGKLPVITVSWNDITQKYIPWLNQKTGKNYRLPTEAEWEYAARGGTDKAYPWGNNIGKNNASCDGCGSQWDNKQTAPVGSFSTNGYGLYDTSGNVWEWVADCYSYSYQGAAPDGTVRNNCGTSIDRILRSGSWNFLGNSCRSANRNAEHPDLRDKYSGFRLALSR
ncbi:MAG: SUMF1/EgtB/PvdO family nonheme iron enzyme [Thiothrix sp.]|uniref:SUMF1/EgtB/PvdO family nonheme iron enzyme n=1 Tax=Thiothrix sp. TaxID=1032 RepID=UPI002627F610|nr:SUMF1/EgtB/PvdO family nonheme iron enzyme [Thiothrix sp.]MDD5391559.1 SUMF1/EgtB/PvdO family nonheme iron enzyme [Thiothrix sp.]